MKRVVIFLLLLLFLGIVLYIVTPKSNTLPSESKKETTSLSESSPTPQGKKVTENIVIQGKKIMSGQNVIKVKEGEMIDLSILSDEDEELHIHGYDVSVKLEKNKAARVTFEATITGRFEYELEEAETVLGALEVEPK